MNELYTGAEQAEKYRQDLIKLRAAAAEKDKEALDRVKKAAFEEGVQHAVDAIRAAMKNHGFVCKTLNPDLLALQKEVGLLVYPLSLNRQAEDRIHRVSGNGHNPQNLVKPVDDSVLEVLKDKRKHMADVLDKHLEKWKEHDRPGVSVEEMKEALNPHESSTLTNEQADRVLEVLQDKQAIMDEQLKKWKEGPAKSYFETLTNEQADRVLELVRQKRQDDKEVNALPNSVHAVYDEVAQMSEEQWDAAVAGLRKYQDKHLQNKDLCKGDDT